jgi:hypothetical protein
MQTREPIVALIHSLRHSDIELSDPQTLLAALQRLGDDISQEGQALFARWRPTIRRRAFLNSGLTLASYLKLRRRATPPDTHGQRTVALHH